MVETEVSQKAAASGPTVQMVTDSLKKSVTCNTTVHNNTEYVTVIVLTVQMVTDSLKKSVTCKTTVHNNTEYVTVIVLTVQMVTDSLKKSVTCKTTVHNNTEYVTVIVLTLLIKKGKSVPLQARSARRVPGS